MGVLLHRAAAELSSSRPGRPVPFSRRLLLKSLLRAIGAATYAFTTASWQPSEDEARQLYAVLAAVLRRAGDFGGGLFALAARGATNLLHQDPLQYR